MNDIIYSDDLDTSDKILILIFINKKIPTNSNKDKL